MRKIFTTVVALAFVAMGFVSCQKEQTGGLQFTATMGEQVSDNQGKTAYDAANGLHWVDGDMIFVCSEDLHSYGMFSATPQSDNPRCAVFSDRSRNYGFSAATLTEADAPYYAVYPYDGYDQAYGILFQSLDIINNYGVAINALAYLPMEYNTQAGELTNFPMMAHSATTNLQFKNLAGAIRLHLTKPDVSISRIVVRSDGQQLSGLFDAGFSAYDVPTLSVFANPNVSVDPLLFSDSVVVNCSGNPSIAQGHDFFIPMPAGTYSGLEFTIYASDGRICTKTMNANASMEIVRSQYSTITLDGGSLYLSGDNLLPGKFSVSYTHSVRFSRGNLLAMTNGGVPSAANTTWSFHQNQYSACSSNNNVYDYCDLFGFSSPSTYYGLSTSTNNNDYSGDFVDWGTVFGPESHWRTLTSDEWNYLINYRAASTINGTRNARYAFIRLTSGSSYRNGLLLFPDTFTWPSVAGSAPTSLNTIYCNSLPSYTIAQFSALQAAGCVFLPCASVRYGETIYGFRSYWTSTIYDQNSARIFNFSSSAYGGTNVEPSTAIDGRYKGCPVRLVQDVN